MAGFIDQIQESMSSITSLEQMLGKGLNIPYNATNSGSRKIMDNTHQSHALVLTTPDVPYVSTGFENKYGERSSSIITAENNYHVIAKISKFQYAPNHHYYLIAVDEEHKTLDVFERISYKYRTEVYGYLHNNSLMDSFSEPGTFIPKGQVLRRSTGFDQYGNNTPGKNLNIAYMALDDNMEDSVIISEECSEKMRAPLFRTVKIIINENDIPLNIYGNDDIYKVFPDIGEDVKNGILLSYRREKREEAIYTQSVQRLQQIMMSDEKITVKGKIIDINIYCNNPEYISKSTYNKQFYSYYLDRLRVDSEIINAIGPYLANGYELTYRLDKLFGLAKDEISGKKFIDKKQFSNLLVEFTVMENRKLEVGDKVSDRYGGKGVISKIIPTNLMPKMSNGLTIDMIKNSSTMYNRENAGQIFELEENYISMCILDRIRNSTISNPKEALNDILTFMKIQSPNWYEYIKKQIEYFDDEQLLFFVNSILSKTCILVPNLPMSETMTIDKLGELYNAFPWIKPESAYVPIVDSRGNYRFIPTRRPMIVAPQYCFRLKQFAEEKFSATSLSSTNLRNENSKSKASKNYREPNSNTPIKFGQMESGDFDHMGTEHVVINLMLHSLSPHGRRLVEQIATGDPYNVDVKLDSKSKNRSAEILNTRLKTMGYRIVFKKTRKIKKEAALINAVSFVGSSRSSANMINAVEFHDKNYDFDHYYKTIDEIEELKKKMPMIKEAVEFIDNNNNHKK